MASEASFIDRLPAAFAISLGLRAADPLYAGRVRGAQLAAMVRFTPVAMVASCLNGLILLLVLQRSGRLNATAIAWGCVLLASTLYHMRVWVRSRGRTARSASKHALGRAALHGGLFGAVWGAVPVLTLFADSPPAVQLVVGCLTAGMMCAGAFVLATVPLAGFLYMAAILCGATFALLPLGGNVINLGLAGLLWVYAAVVLTSLCFSANLFVEHFLGEARLQAEIQAREQAQAQVTRSQRMTALGELAGGIAHDFNNILQSITGNASLVARRAEDPEEARRLAGSILDTAERGGTISRRLLAFARQDALSAEPVHVGALLLSAADLLEHTLPPSIRLEVQAAADLPFILADQAQLETILVNLAANARDAMPDGGTLSLGAAAEAVPAGAAYAPLKAGDYVRITLADSGCGMDPDTLARAAEPFFTTKIKGKGTGLGLAMAKGFAEQSGGALAIESARGRGTVVTVWLPQTDARAAGKLPPPAAPLVLEPPHHLLLVDDDDDVRETLLRCLLDAGFNAIAVANAEAALKRLDEGLQVDVIITDFAMPGMNGIDLVRAARRRRTGLSAVLLTGQVAEMTLLGDEAFTVLQKPIRPAELSRRVWATLAERAAV